MTKMTTEMKTENTSGVKRIVGANHCPIIIIIRVIQ
jgi:hypothetical protein